MHLKCHPFFCIHHYLLSRSCCLLAFLPFILYQAESKCALVYGQMNEPPGARARVGLTGLTVAEHFRDAEGQDVLLFIDNIFRFTQVSTTIE